MLVSSSTVLSRYLFDIAQLTVKCRLPDAEQASGFEGLAARLLIGGHDHRPFYLGHRWK